MEIVLIVLVIALLAGGVGLAVSRRSLRKQEGAERRAAERPPARPVSPPTPAVPREAPPVELDEALGEAILEPDLVVEPEVLAPVKPKLRDRLGKARALLSGYFGDLRSRDKIDEEVWEELEEALIRADVGVTVTGQLLDDLRQRVKETGVTTPAELIDLLKADITDGLSGTDRSLAFTPGEVNVWMFVGVNGVGKTTTIGKLGQREADAGRTVVMAAADTFRAAAAEQLELWAKRAGADLVRGPGRRRSRLGRVRRDERRGQPRRRSGPRRHRRAPPHQGQPDGGAEEAAPHRGPHARARSRRCCWSSTPRTGQNGLVQAKQFAEAVGVTGVVLTKLDGTAKGGIVLAVQSELGHPVKLVGVGEARRRPGRVRPRRVRRRPVRRTPERPAPRTP